MIGFRQVHKDMCMCACVCAQARADAHLCICGGQRHVVFLSESLFTLTFDMGSLTVPDAHQFSWTIQPAIPDLLLPRPQPQCWNYRHMKPHLAFYLGSGDQTQVLMLAQQVLYQLGSLS